jgi:hypothetical protein
MANLYNKTRLYLEANGKTEAELYSNNIVLQNDSDGKGDYIHTWNVSGLAQPTDAQLDALDAQATTLESNNQVDVTRRKEYGNWKDQLDEIYHDIDAWKARLLTIKNSNPKGG